MLIGLDIGTSKIAAILYDPVKSIITGIESIPNNAGVCGLPLGYKEQDAEKIFEAVLKLILNITKRSEIRPGKITGLAITGQQHGIVLVDKDLNPLSNLITWQDKRSEDAPVTFRYHSYSEDTGCFLHSGYGGLTLKNWDSFIPIG